MVCKSLLILLNFMISARCLSGTNFLAGLRFTPFHTQLGFIQTNNRNSNRCRIKYFGSNRMTPSEGGEEVTVFHKIVAGELPCNKVYEDDLMLAFRDIEPVAPNHILLVPKKFDGLARLGDATERHEKVLGHMMVKAAQIAKDNNLGDFRLVVNSGPEALQTVFYLHMHLLSGRKFKWPPG